MGDKKVAIIGSGLVGKSYAMMFAGAGYNVVLYDIVPEQVTAAMKEVAETLKLYEKNGHLRGKDTADQQAARISGSTTLEDCVKGAVYLQECVPELLELKVKVFKQLDALADDKIILASSTSCIMASEFTKDLKHQEQCIVAHPVNPPYFVPLVEIVPAPWTRSDVVSDTRSILTEIGQSPVTLSKEIPGFALNRMQYAVLNECWRMAEDGLLSTKDINTVMSEGLGMRYAFLGPFETSHLNAEGFKSYCDRYGPSIVNVSNGFGPVPSWTGDSKGGKCICDQLNKDSPLEKLDERRKWRDEKLAALSKLKKS